MTQRALIPIVAAARSALKGLIDHSFEGVPYGEASLNEFSKQNLRAGALDVTSYSPNGVSNPGFANLIVAKGSIDESFTLEETTEKGNQYVAIEQPSIYFPAAKANDPATVIFNYLEKYARDNNIPLLKPGTQFTFLTVYEAGTVSVKSAAGATDASLSDFVLDRFMIPNSETGASQIEDVNGPWKVKNEVTAGDSEVTIVNTVGDEINIKGSNSSTGGNISITVNPKAAAKDANCGGALILSRYENGTWRRSSASIKIGFEPKHKYTFDDWLSTYQSTGAASKKYLNNGDEGTGIQGEQSRLFHIVN